MSAMLSSDATFSMEMFPFGHCLEGNGDVSSATLCISATDVVLFIGISVSSSCWSLTRKQQLCFVAAVVLFIVISATALTVFCGSFSGSVGSVQCSLCCITGSGFSELVISHVWWLSHSPCRITVLVAVSQFCLQFRRLVSFSQVGYVRISFYVAILQNYRSFYIVHT
ncbi:hypothetical protein Tco_1488981 [Tanacetum coccineum]